MGLDPTCTISTVNQVKKPWSLSPHLLCPFQKIGNPGGAGPCCLFEIDLKAISTIFWGRGITHLAFTLQGQGSTEKSYSGVSVGEGGVLPAPGGCAGDGTQAGPAAFSVGSHQSHWPSPQWDPVPKKGARQTCSPCKNKAA